jgi:hypothetical protein
MTYEIPVVIQCYRRGLGTSSRITPVETLGEAFSQCWRVTARCAHGKIDNRTNARDCAFRAELDTATLLWTRGRAFPLSRLESRLRCPRCGSRHIVVLFEPPAQASPTAATAGRAG